MRLLSHCCKAVTVGLRTLYRPAAEARARIPHGGHLRAEIGDSGGAGRPGDVYRARKNVLHEKCPRFIAGGLWYVWIARQIGMSSLATAAR